MDFRVEFRYRLSEIKRCICNTTRPLMSLRNSEKVRGNTLAILYLISELIVITVIVISCSNG